MFRYLTISAIVLGALIVIAQPLAAQRLVVGARYFGPHYYVAPAFGFGYGYGPGWYYPGYYPGWGPAYAVARARMGEVKVITHLKDASVYVDGGFAGSTGKLKHFNLPSGNHDIEVRDPGGHTIYQEKVQVLLDKTTEIRLNQ